MSEVIADDEREDLLYALGPCSQCGRPFTARACGPTHALISSDPLRPRLLGPFLRARDEQVRSEEREKLVVVLDALDRTESRFRQAISGKPVRDMAETLADNAAARQAALTA